MHWYREGALDGHLGVFNLSRFLVVPHVVGCDDVACVAGRFDLDQLEEEDLRVNPLRDRTLDRPAGCQIAAKDKNIADIALALPLMMRIGQNVIVSLPLA